MGVWQVPSYVKPYIRILSWTLPLAFEEESKREVISDYLDVSPVLRGVIRYFKDYYRVAVGKVLVRNLIQSYKVAPEPKSMTLRAVQEFIDICCREALLRLKDVKASLVDATGISFIEKVFEGLNEDLRAVIAKPTQWLVLVSNGKQLVLTRMCWLIGIEGDVEVRRYGFNNVLLVINKAVFEKINTADLRSIKRNAVKKEELNDRWAQLVSESRLEAAIEGVETEQEELPVATEEEKASDRIGVVE